MGGDKQIGTAKDIAQTGHPVYQHITGTWTHEQFNATDTVFVQLCKLSVIVVGCSEITGIVDGGFLA